MKKTFSLFVMAVLLFMAVRVFAQKHEYVDLGLPSGTLWATCNVGANAPEDYGDYFAWGETTTKGIYVWDTYKYVGGYDAEMTKYCYDSFYGYKDFTDTLTTLQMGDDPAAANWGEGWCIPTKAQWEELLNNTTHQWTTRNGVKGRLFTSKKNGQSLFMPAAGYRRDDELRDAGSYGYYWSSSLDTNSPHRACDLGFTLDECDMETDNRYRGFSVRPVRSSR